MKCPHCGETGSCHRVTRAGIFPTPVALLYLTYEIALFWTLGRPWIWKCRECGARFRQHSGFSLIWRILAWGLIGLFGLAVIGALLSLAAYGFLQAR